MALELRHKIERDLYRSYVEEQFLYPSSDILWCNFSERDLLLTISELSHQAALFNYLLDNYIKPLFSWD